jgi:hypothetical protein
MNSIALETRNNGYVNHIGLLNSFKETDIRIKDSELRASDYQRMNSENAQRMTLDLYKVKGELEKQASDNANIAVRDMLTTRSDIMRQSLENTMSIQTEALKNKDCLSKQMMECCCEIKEKISSTDSFRIRDDLIEKRIENSYLKNERFEDHHHRPHYDYHHQDHHGHRDHPVNENHNYFTYRDNNNNDFQRRGGDFPRRGGSV